jgi:hypothetical protein
MFNTLQLTTLDKVPTTRAEVFRVSTLGLVIAVVIVSLLLAGCIVAGVYAIFFEDEGFVVGLILLSVGFWIGLYWLFVVNDLAKATKPTAWLAVLADRGVYVKWRSYRNIKWGLDDPQVVLVPYSVIKSARLHKRLTITPQERHGGSRHESGSFVELQLGEVDTAALEAQLAEERTGKPNGVRMKTRWVDFPVTVEPGRVLRIEWRGRRKAREFLDRLATRGVVIEDVRKSTIDLTDAPSDEDLQELARRGDSMGIVRSLRSRGKMSLADAKAKAEDLIRKARPN